MSNITPRSSDQNLESESINSHFKFSFNLLKASSVLLASVALVACGGGGGTPATPTTTTPAALTTVNGFWTACGNDGVSSQQTDLTLADGNSTAIVSTFASADCGGDAVMQEVVTRTYTLGSQVALNGSVANITSATQFTFTDTTVGGADNGKVVFSLVAIKGNQAKLIFFGDTNGTNDGSTAALRAIQLDDFSLGSL